MASDSKLVDTLHSAAKADIYRWMALEGDRWDATTDLMERVATLAVRIRELPEHEQAPFAGLGSAASSLLLELAFTRHAVDYPERNDFLQRALERFLKHV